MVQWDAQDRVEGERFLAERFQAALVALVQIDRDGHELLLDAGEDEPDGLALVVGLALFRRAVAQFTGLRRLAQLAMPQQATLLARAHFETSAALRYLIYGGRRSPSFLTPTNSRGRNLRARYFWAEDLRHQVYRRYAALDGRIPSRGRMARKSREGIEEEIRSLIRALRLDFPRQHRKFGPLRARSGKKPQYHDEQRWYSFGFRSRRVRNLRSLCEVFAWTQAYELLYDAYSGWQHPRGLWHDCSLEEESIEVHSPYVLDAFETVTGFSAMLQQFNHMAFAKAYRSSMIPRIQHTSLQTREAIHGLRPSLPPGFA